MKHFLSTTNNGIVELSFSFGFHFMSGLMLFSLPATWLAYNVLQRHYRSVLSDGQTPFRSRLWYPGPFSKRVPANSVVRMIFCLPVAILFMAACCLFESLMGIRLESLQHGLLHGTYFVTGFFDVLVSLTGSEKKAPTSMLCLAGIDRAASVLSAIASFFVFSFHFHGEVALQSQMHVYFSWLSMALVLSHAVEVLGQRHVWMALVRPYVMFLGGTWSMQIGFVLYPLTGNTHTWEDSSMYSKIMVDFLMCCHLVMAFFSLVAFTLFVRRREMASDRNVDINKSDVKYQPLPRDV